MKSDVQGRRKTARIGAVVLKALIVVIAMALPLSAQGPGAWTLSGNLNTARANHAAAALPNGQALIVGGTGSSGKPLTSAEIYSLSSNSFTTLPTGLLVGVSGLTATVLNDNTVLLAGGLNSSNRSVNAAELYSPTTGGFIKLPMMKIARSHHTATLLSDGRVLIAGGALHHGADRQHGDFRSGKENIRRSRAAEACAAGSHGDAAVRRHGADRGRRRFRGTARAAPRFSIPPRAR